MEREGKEATVLWLAVLFLLMGRRPARLDISFKRVGHLVASCVGGIAFMATAIWMLSTGR
ncbi:hypothetical protein [Streptomyces sp. NPDC053560]|uniref:hypothetical protein n=1 Tax=Streptomyces sp. NPDC053560 TaxID=3365711 RepID=UPI0037D56B7B